MHTIATLREETVAAAGAELYVRRAGTGDAVLLAVHGGPGLSHGPLAALEALASPALTVVNYDQRGVGRSSGDVDEAGVLTQALDDLDAVRTAVAPAPVHLLGHSWGGLLAALYASEHPGAVASLTLVDSIPAHAAALQSAFDTYARRLRSFQARGLIPGDLPAADVDPVGRLLALLPMYFVEPAHPAARSLGGMRPAPSVSAAHRTLLGTYDVRDRVARIVAPSLHVIAPVPFGPEMATAMADAMTASPGRRVRPSDAGHLPWLERPTAFAAELRRFLEDTTNPTRKDDDHDP
jgi:proline iminopeptidase